jgi:hypothetical protein
MITDESTMLNDEEKSISNQQSAISNPQSAIHSTFSIQPSAFQLIRIARYFALFVSTVSSTALSASLTAMR